MKIKLQFENLSRAYTGEAEGAVQYVFVDDKRYSIYATIHKGEDATEFQPIVGNEDDWKAIDDDDNVAPFSETKEWQEYARYLGSDASFRNYSTAKKEITENITRLITNFFNHKDCEICNGEGEIYVGDSFDGFLINGKIKHDSFECEECDGKGFIIGNENLNYEKG